MEDIVVNYMKTLSPKKAKQFAMYFKGWKLADEEKPEGLYIVEDSKITDTDRMNLARHLYFHIRQTMSTEKLLEKLENL